MDGDSPSAARRRSGSTLQIGTGHTPTDPAPAAQPHQDSRVSGESDLSGPSSSLDLDEVEMSDMRSDEELYDDEETGLTQEDRKKRRRRKMQLTQLDERIGNDTRSLEKQTVNATLLRYYLINAILIALWYGFSVSISVYNKWMFSEENLDFHYPLFTTSIHMLVQFSLASAVLYFIPRFRPSQSSVNPHAPSYQRVGEQETAQGRREQQPLMTRWFYLTRIGPCGTATALDIGLGNFSLRYISLTFYTMCKSSVLGFVLVFAFIFRLEQPSLKLIAIILVMTAGVIMMVAGEAAFNTLGFILVMSASFCSGFRWSLSQILLLRNAATSNPFSSIFFLTPVMFLALFALAIPIEGPVQVAEGLHVLATTKGVGVSVLLLLFPGTLAFLMVAAEFALLKRTSVVTLSVCGIFKEVVTILTAGHIFGEDDLSPINVSGLCVTIASIAAYNWLKFTRMRSDAKRDAHHLLEEPAVAVHDPDRRKGSGSLLDPGRPSLEALMRDDLALRIDVDIEPARKKSVGGNGTLQSTSPIKRPEDIE